ncbi:MAG: DUF1801 domain-containing protein [Thermoplasmata archaeon]
MEPSEIIDKQIADLGDWRGEMLAAIRRVVHEAAPGIVEEWKWMGTPTWSLHGVVLIANPHKDKVKMTFAQGAHLPDPDKLFNNGLDGNRWRAIDLREGSALHEAALKRLVRSAVRYNTTHQKTKPTGTLPSGPAVGRSRKVPRRVKRP